MKKIIKFLKDYWILLLIVIVPVGWFAAMIVWREAPSKTAQQVHWHMPLSYDLCWDTTQLKDSGEHWKMHGHDDNRAHIEGIVDAAKRNETLWKFFDSANITFSSTQIGKYKNWDVCPGSKKLWKVSVEINGKLNSEFRDYILNDKDEIKIIFK